MEDMGLSTYHMGIDIGAGSGRAMVGKLDSSGKLTLHEIHRFSTKYILIRGKKLINVYSIFSEILYALQLFSRQYNEPLGSIGVDTWATDFGILDKNGDLFGLPFFYRDLRTIGMSKKVDTVFGKQQLHYETGGRSDPCSSLHQLLSLQHKQDISLDHGETLLFLGDILHYFLSGKKVSEYTVASYSQFFNMKRNGWSDTIFQHFDLPIKIQPTLIYPGTVIGNILPEILEQTGVKGNPFVIAPAIHDTASAVLAVPESESYAFISSGTWSLVGITLDKPLMNKKTYDFQISSTGLSFQKILFKKNIVGAWIVQQCLDEWRVAGQDISYDVVDAQVKQAVPFWGYIDPDDSLFSHPEYMIEAIQHYLEASGQKSVQKNDIGQILRIVYESMAMKYNYALNLILLASRQTIKKISIIGGGSKNTLLNQFTASVTGLEVFAGPSEASVIGNIMMQAYGVGEVSGESEIKKIVKNSCTIKHFFPIDCHIWQKEYQRFLSACCLQHKKR